MISAGQLKALQNSVSASKVDFCVLFSTLDLNSHLPKPVKEDKEAAKDEKEGDKEKEPEEKDIEKEKVL